MMKHLRTIKVSLILGMILLSSLAVMTTASAGVINYPSVISIEIAPESLDALKDPVDIDGTLYVKLNIGYAVSVPDKLLDGGMAARMWVFGSMILPPQMIHLEIVDQPEWANIALTTPDVYVLDFSNSMVYTSADVIITPYDDAPAMPKTITISAEANGIGKILPSSFHTTLSFEPDYMPLLSINVEEPIRQASPRESLNFNINVKNVGNKQTIVTPRIVNADAKWAPIISTPFIILQPGETSVLTFSVTTPYDFGWHNDLSSFTLELTPRKSTAGTSSNATGASLPVQVQVNSVGFSTPGFEIFTAIAAIGICGILIRWRTKK